ncbi:hypothetical protein BP422_22070 [Brevibacillus formosus]|uniref:Uncharacterized protein n=1 Tax=Brevibacillus formosus TaxID=54913 RepID=A0A220MML2_9BACL|nr:hypothetical protein [Brevibacillus formosus]ASJ55995.1 hypothetical protein BP422_22070 [Brevibacillus formosus]
MTFTIGCIGTLKDWLTKTLEMNLMKGKNTIDIDDFKEYALSLNQCIKMIREAREGEISLEESDEKKKTLYSLLMANGNFGSDDNNEEVDQSNSPVKKNNKKGKPGKRNPKRDTVGGAKESGSDAV